MRSTLTTTTRLRFCPSRPIACGPRQTSMLLRTTACPLHMKTSRPPATTSSAMSAFASLATAATDGGVRELDSLPAIFADAEATFPLRFREHGWYLTVVRAATSSCLAHC